MKKIFVMLAAALMGAATVNAQSRHEIAVSYGLGVSMIGDGISNAITFGVFDAIAHNETTSKEFGTLGVEYFYHLNNPRLAVGGIMTYARKSENVVERASGEKFGDRKRQFISLMPSLKYYWINKDHLGLYSKVAVGGILTTATSKIESDGQKETGSAFSFMGQLSAIGIDGGSRHIRAFAELGVGEQGIILGGLRVKF